MTAALSIDALTKRYDSGVVALDQLTLQVPEGAFFGLLGPNGAGKTTLIRAICGLVRPTAGSIEVFGHDAQRRPVQARRLVGLSPQDPNLDAFLTVRETLIYHARYYGVSGTEAEKRCERLLDTFDLAAKSSAKTTQLSGGMKRRLLLARAFMHDPPIIMLDEPTAGVDLELRHELWRYIRAVHEAGRTVILTTHYLEEAEMLCDDVALIQYGRIAAHGTPDQLKQQYDKESLEGVYLEVVGQ